MKTVRFSKIVMALMIVSFAFMITLNNILDYRTNYAFVQHVLSMDTTFPNNTLMYRAITSESLWHFSYWLIIAGEGLICLFFLMGSLALWRARYGTAEVFHHAKKWIYVGATMAMSVWFFGFMVIGSEWFLMWQSREWKGQEAAFRFYMSVLGVLIYINQRYRDISL